LPLLHQQMGPRKLLQVCRRSVASHSPSDPLRLLLLGPAKLKWYAERPECFENVSLFDLMSQCEEKKYILLPKAKWRVR
jgi:hypothetical protein